ncbi:27 kDa putative replicase protein [Pelargonium chlorotic ring pattern virus]|nr:27 kDa putative replicase protein [Pelargonium chlorotic ring pattern virus]AAT69550.1 27 kDa putative replicase protein [Pelargonium chlorotic ring pattern virus]
MFRSLVTAARVGGALAVFAKDLAVLPAEVGVFATRLIITRTIEVIPEYLHMIAPGASRIPKSVLTGQAFTSYDVEYNGTSDLENSCEVATEDVIEVEGKTTKVVKTRRARNKLQFSALLAIAAKNHFGGIVRPTRANELSVMKFLTSKCNDHKLTIAQTRSVCCAAFPLVFSPDEGDKLIFATLNSEEAFERRQDYSEAQGVGNCWLNLLSNPCSRRRWRRVVLRCFGMPVQEAFQFAK